MLIKMFLKNWRQHLFILIQLALVIFLINSQISNCVMEYKKMTGITETGQNLYFYKNVLGNLSQSEEYSDFEQQKEAICKMPGVINLVYAQTISCEVAGYHNKNLTETDIERWVQQYNMNESMSESIQYNLTEGRWLTKEDESSDTMKIIVGGGLSQRYVVGDVIELNYEDGSSYQAEIVGKMGADHCLIDQDGIQPASKDVSEFTTQLDEKEDTIISNSIKLEKEKKEFLYSPATSIMLTIAEGTDLAEYGKYGVICSFDQVMERTQRVVDRYISYALETNFIWILLALFGIATTAYINTRERRYTNAILLLLGMTNRQLKRISIIQSAILVILSMGISCGLKWIIENFMEVEKSPLLLSNWAGMLILSVLLLVIDSIFRGYINKMQPIEIFHMTKE